jgi:hypothetical protein
MVPKTHVDTMDTSTDRLACMRSSHSSTHTKYMHVTYVIIHAFSNECAKTFKASSSAISHLGVRAVRGCEFDLCCV